MVSIDRAAPTAVAAAAVAAPAASADAPAAAASGPKITERGLLVDNPEVLRNVLRWGGIAAAVGGIGALAFKASQGGGINAIRGTSFLPLAIAGAAIGAVMVGVSFLGGLQPQYKPFAASDIAGLEDAQAKAVELGDDMAILKTGDDRFSVVDYSDKDFDNANLGALKIDSENIPWEGLVSKDGDFIRPTGPGSWDVVGRAHPDPVNVAALTVSDAAALVGERIGTTDAHGAATLGRVVGNPAGYASLAEAAVAAHGVAGNTAIVQLGGSFVLLEANLPPGASVSSLQARGTGISPVTAIVVQEGKKLFRPAEPGADLGFVGRSIPFSPSEPIGANIAGHSVVSLLASNSSRDQLANQLRSDSGLADAVFFGRSGGGAIVRSQDPDGKVGFHLYELAPGRSGANWDEQLADVRTTLTRNVRTDTDYDFFAPYGVSSQWAIDQAYVRRTDLARTTVRFNDDDGPDATLRDSGWTQTGSQVDYWQTQQYRERLRDELYVREHPGGTTSPGDDGGGSTSPGDDHGSSSGSGSTSSGDSGGSTRPVPPSSGDSGSGDTGSGDDDGGSTPTPPTRPTDPPGGGTSPGDSTDNGNPDLDDF